ncbi:MAG: threonine ammonia-lyase [Fusobacteriaceae bacterium]|nr:threonine ammonia-lyase [Fusobacteriaceae bacterium]
MSVTVNLDLIKQAQKTIAGIAKKTPLIESHAFEQIEGARVYFKCENLQKTGSFKIRGAINKIASLTEEEKKRGVIASSAGNHAQGVALGATAQGIHSTIVMPETAPLAKISATKGYGAEVVLHGAAYDDAYEKACALQKEQNSVFLHPYNDPYVIAGQGTIALEILEDLPDVDMVLVPIGGGGMLSGIATGLKESRPDIEVIGVETANIPSMKVSIDNKKITTVPPGVTIADGINVRTPGDITFSIIQKYVDKIVTVTENEIADAVLFLMEKGKIVAEGSGATPLAAVLAGKVDCRNKKVCVLISGGNVDIPLIDRILNRALINQGRRYEFRVKVQDRYGEAERLVRLITESRANILFLTQTMYNSDLGINMQEITFVIECSDMEHRNRVKELLRQAGYEIN